MFAGTHTRRAASPFCPTCLRPLLKSYALIMNIKSKFFYLARKYSTFSTIVLTALLFGFCYFLYEVIFTNKGAITIAEQIIVAIGIIVAAATATLLPADFIRTKKDQKICRALKIDYDTFAIKTEVEKDEIREQFSKHA